VRAATEVHDHPQHGSACGGVDPDEIQGCVGRVCLRGDLEAELVERKVRDEELGQVERLDAPRALDARGEWVKAREGGGAGAQACKNVGRVATVVAHPRLCKEADAQALHHESALLRRARLDQVDRTHVAADRQLGGPLPVERDAEAARDVVGPAGRYERQLARRSREVHGGVNRAVAADEHQTPAVGVSPHVREVRQRCGVDQVGVRAGGAKQVEQARSAAVDSAAVPIDDHQQGKRRRRSVGARDDARVRHWRMLKLPHAACIGSARGLRSVIFPEEELADLQ
jgi:hypothetical protein